MSSRPSVVVTNRVPADGGEHPNRFVGEITAQLRVHYPPNVRREEIDEAIRAAYRGVIAELDRRIPAPEPEPRRTGEECGFCAACLEGAQPCGVELHDCDLCRWKRGGS